MSPSSTPKFKNPRAKYNFQGRTCSIAGVGAYVPARVLTNADLEKMVEEKTFRLDLYYRLNVIPLHIPSLKDRQECLVPLIRHYFDYFGARNGTPKRLSRSAIDALIAYSYPGNVRELINICERLVVMSETEVIGLQDLPGQIAGHGGQTVPAVSDGSGSVWPPEMTLEQIMESVERTLLADAMKEHGNQYRIADALGINQSTVARKLKKYGIS